MLRVNRCVRRGPIQINASFLDVICATDYAGVTSSTLDAALANGSTRVSLSAHTAPATSESD